MSQLNSTENSEIKITKYVNLGNTGLKVSPLCLGCMSFGSSKWEQWVLEEEASLKILKRAFYLGINFFDTADVYSNGESERILGKFLKVNDIPRENVVLATKVFSPVDHSGNQENKIKSLSKGVPNTFGLSRKHIMHAVEYSLKNLQTDYIDLYIIHRWDNNTPIEETMETLHDLVKSGKVRYIGASSMWAWQFAKAQHVAEMRGWTKFVSMQNLYNLVYREEEREMIPLCVDQKVTITPWSPLARGLLARASELVAESKQESQEEASTTRANSDFYAKAMKNSLKESDMEILRRVAELSEKKQCTNAQLALAWMLHKSYVSSAVIGVTKLENIEANIAACHIQLTNEELKYLEEPYQAKAVMGNLQ